MNYASKPVYTIPPYLQPTFRPELTPASEEANVCFYTHILRQETKIWSKLEIEYVNFSLTPLSLLCVCVCVCVIFFLFRLLTSKLAKQYQQNTCLHRLHIIWAHPSSFSMGTAHIGQHLMRSVSNGMPMLSSTPSAVRRRAFSSQLNEGCHCVGTK